MNALRIRGTVFCVACLLAALAPASALAKKGTFVIDASRSAELHLKASNGFSISVWASRGTVFLTASRDNEQVTYRTSGHTDKGRIRASFGEVGSLAVRLHPSGKPKHVPLPDGNCRGRGHVATKGTFVGSIVFEGEQLYAARHATRARGREVHAFKETCRRVKEDAQETDHSLRVTSLLASGKPEKSESGSRCPVLFAFRTVSIHPVWNSSAFSATLSEDRGRVSIERTTSANAGLKAFEIEKTSAGTTTATLTPPAPFTGAATYSKGRKGPGSWSGDLSVPFLGVGVVPLSGADWTAQLSSF